MVPDAARTDAAEPERRALDDADTALVARSLRTLAWPGRADVLAELSGGGSGAAVFRVDLDGRPAVLKVTEDPALLERAGRELEADERLAASLGTALPTRLAGQRDRRAVRLLLAASPPFPPAPEVVDDAWVAAAEQLAQVHAVPAATVPWLAVRAWPSEAQVVEAVRRWSGHGSARAALRGAEQLPAARRASARLPAVLTHGDGHAGNLLRRTDGRVVWVDWQEAFRSDGLDDLVFLWQRAEFDGADPPRAAMTAAYAAARGLPLDGTLRSALRASELRLLLVAWPPFLHHGGPDRRRRMARRLEQLVAGDDR